jgi:LacI family transcriptional regulator, gluconate utilization system Gnt-I transcriptional repressor
MKLQVLTRHSDLPFAATVFPYLLMPSRKLSLKAATDAPQRQARPGHGRLTLQDVAAAAGVTAITVSRYLREPAVVAADTAERVRAALAATGYVPNKQAGLLASGTGNIVAVLLPNLANSIFAETAQGLSDGLQSAGYELLIASTGYSSAREEHQLRALLGWNPAAVVVTGRRHTPGARRLLEDAQSAGTPVIEIWDYHPPAQDTQRTAFTQIGFNHDEVGQAMAHHLLGLGHLRVAYVDSGVAEDYRAHERGLAFARTVAQAGGQAKVMVAPEGDAFDAGRHMVEPLLADGPETLTAAAFANDHLACGALLEAVARGISVPQRLALLGFGDFALARQLIPGLSSVRLPRHDIGEKTAASLLDALRKRRPAVSAALPWQLMIRGSTHTEI